jgi:DNA-binding response OmpR family regulator
MLAPSAPKGPPTIVDGLAGFGFGVDLFTTGGDGLAATRSVTYDAIVLDLGLPDGDGLDLIDDLREATNRIPVLILTARDGVDDRGAGLDRGAEDYLLKPFAMTPSHASCGSSARISRRPDGACGPWFETLGLWPSSSP